MHAHLGDEVLRIISGEIIVRVGAERQRCRAGDVAVVPPNVLHGFQAVQDTLMEVVPEYDIGTLFPVRQADGTRRLVRAERATNRRHVSIGMGGAVVSAVGSEDQHQQAEREDGAGQQGAGQRQG